MSLRETVRNIYPFIYLPAQAAGGRDGWASLRIPYHKNHTLCGWHGGPYSCWSQEGKDQPGEVSLSLTMLGMMSCCAQSVKALSPVPKSSWLGARTENGCEIDRRGDKESQPRAGRPACYGQVTPQGRVGSSCSLQDQRRQGSGLRLHCCSGSQPELEPGLGPCRLCACPAALGKQTQKSLHGDFRPANGALG